jgi:cell wall-associated NlpC family hydrolase
MLKKTLFVVLSTLILSGVCFAQADPAKAQKMENTTPAATQEQPAVTQEQPAATQEQPAATQEQPAATQEQPAKEQMKETTPAAAPEQPALVLEEIHICTNVENREPTGVGTIFPDDLGKLYCFTKIGGAEGTAYVYHVWYFGDKEIARVKLPVKSKSWRTWSSKKFNMVLGSGHVEVVSESGAVLGKAEFEIQPAQKPQEVEKTEMPAVPEAPKEVPKEAPKAQ